MNVGLTIPLSKFRWLFSGFVFNFLGTREMAVAKAQPLLFVFESFFPIYHGNNHPLNSNGYVYTKPLNRYFIIINLKIIGILVY